MFNVLAMNSGYPKPAPMMSPATGPPPPAAYDPYSNIGNKPIPNCMGATVPITMHCPNCNTDTISKTKYTISPTQWLI